MNNLRKHNPVLQNRLRQFLEAGDVAALHTALDQLSAADFRSAGYLLADHLLPDYPEMFWKGFLTIVPSRPKAYLGTFLKALVKIYEKDEKLLNFAALDCYAREYATPIDVRKCLEYLLPLLQSLEEVERLLTIFEPATEKSRAILLLKAGTPLCYYLLFKTLVAADADKAEVREYCIYLMKKGDSLSFNMAVILRSYFDLTSLPGTFSLNLEPYQLGRLYESYDHFKKVIFME